MSEIMYLCAFIHIIISTYVLVNLCNQFRECEFPAFLDTLETPDKFKIITATVITSIFLSYIWPISIPFVVISILRGK